MTYLKALSLSREWLTKCWKCVFRGLDQRNFGELPFSTNTNSRRELNLKVNYLSDHFLNSPKDGTKLVPLQIHRRKVKS